MAIKASLFKTTTIVLLIISSSAQAENKLTITQAVKTALHRDAMIQVYENRGNAYKQQAIAEDTLPDPQVKLGMANLPTDTYKRNQEPMTQLQLGITQMFPRGNSLEIKSQRATSMAAAEIAKTDNQRRKVKRDVRKTWLELYYWLNAERVVNKNRSLFKKLVSVTKQQYAAGRQKQQDVIRSELELGMLDDRELSIKTQVEVVRARLTKYLGEEFAATELDDVLPVYSVSNRSLSWIDEHPLIKMEQAMVISGEKNVELAKQSYKPTWMLDLTYGKRENTDTGIERPDFVSAMVRFDLPLFTADKQDKEVAASKARLNSAEYAREERKRELSRMWQASLAKEKRLALRLKKYQSSLLPIATENTRAALYSYQSGRGAFNALMRAQIIELETQLQALRLDVDHKKVQAQLLYFVGEV